MTLSDAPLSFEQPITVNTYSKAYSEGDNHSRECVMLRYVYINVVDDKEGELGTLRALQIHRDTHHEYLGALDADSREMYEFATTLFDESGDFRSELIEDDYLRGTGVWGRELDNDAPLLYINSIHVEEKVRVQWNSERIPKLITRPTVAQEARNSILAPANVGAVRVHHASNVHLCLSRAIV